MAASLPKKIGKYDVVDVIGKGGMGIVYRAKDPFLDRMVAIKIMTISYADSPDLLERFYREAKATAHLQHPNIVTVYELGEQDGSPYLVMQFLEGVSLESALHASQKLTLLQKIDVIIETCHGLAYAHQRGIVHRDIKPGNIMVLKDGSVKIVDFGIARIGDTNFTRAGQFMGSLSYMSLEQLNDKLQVDQRTDVYSTGVVLYQIVTGSLPFEAESTGATLMKIMNEAPPPFSKFLSSFPPELETITLKALAKDRDQRYASADELALDLTQLQTKLRHESIDVHMQQAEILLQRNELSQANDQLMEVLRIDKQHARAMTLLRSLRKQIEKEHSAERARQLREQAEEALRREDFDPALSYVEQALSLDTTNFDLQELRNKVLESKAEIERMRQIFQRAESAHRAGNLDTAKQAIEEVMAFRPDDTRVKSLYRMIQKELEDRARQQRMQSLLQSAQKEIANRHYTDAFSILQEAEKVDPEAPQLRALLEKFSAARELERRRKDLEQITRQVEQAINTDDPESALRLADEGLKRYPAEPSLAKLRDLAETQRQVAQTKSFVRERIAAAREVLDGGNPVAAVKMLEEALRKAPGNPHLESLISLAQEKTAQAKDDQAKANCVQQANAALGRGAFAEAIQLLEAGQLRFVAAPEIDSLLRFAREQQARAAAQQEVDRTVRRAHDFIRAQEYDRAIELLEPVLARIPNDELRIVFDEACQRRDDLHRQIDAAVAKGRQFLDEGAPGKALEFLRSQTVTFGKSDAFRELLAAAASQATVAASQAKAAEAEAQAQAQAPAPEVKAPEVIAPHPSQDWEAPAPMGTMMWGGTPTAPPPVAPQPAAPPPEIRKPAAPQAPAPRAKAPQAPAAPPPKKEPKKEAAPKPAIAKPVAPREPAPELAAAAPKSSQKLIIVVAAIAAVVIVGVAVAWVLSSSGNKKQVVVTPPVSVEKTPETKPPVAVGSLSVTTSVDGADIFVDDTLRGSTSNKKLVVQLPPGSHQVRAEKGGFASTAPQAINIANNTETQVKLTLTASAGPVATPPKDSYLAIKGPTGAAVRVDGAPAGTLPSDTSLFVKVTPDSPHRIEATLNGYKSWSESKSVKPGERLQLTAVMAALSRPVVVSFAANPSTVQPGQSATLSWQTSNATEVGIEGVASTMQLNGSVAVNPDKTTTYKLVAKGEGGSVGGETTVNVAAPNKPTVSASANPISIQAGQSTTLTWLSQNATQILVNGTAHSGAEGSITVTPDKTTTFTVEAKGPGGIANTAVTVNVQPVAAPPPVNQPKPAASDAIGIQIALDRLSEAYGTELLSEIKKAWPGMSKPQESGLKQILSNKEMRAIAMQYDGCSNPAISGDAASMTCTEKMSYTFGGQRKTITQMVAISLNKAAGAWKISSKEPRK
ncbi:MAG TPA: protein kinase [Candidatus Sulfotelmatobacter sp.]